MNKFRREHKFCEEELYLKISNMHPWKVKDFISLKNLTGLYKSVKPISESAPGNSNLNCTYLSANGRI